MEEASQDYNLVSVLKKKWIIIIYFFIETKKQKPKQKQRKWTSIKQEDINKQQDNANPTMQEMNTIQVDCCKKMFTKIK